MISFITGYSMTSQRPAKDLEAIQKKKIVPKRIALRTQLSKAGNMPWDWLWDGLEINTRNNVSTMFRDWPWDKIDSQVHVIFMYDSIQHAQCSDQTVIRSDFIQLSVQR